MNKATRIWLVFAIVLCSAVAVMNAFSGRIESSIVAAVAIVLMIILLATQRKVAYYGIIACYVVSFLISVSHTIGQPGMVVGIVMSVIGSALAPAITGGFLSRTWSELK